MTCSSFGGSCHLVWSLQGLCVSGFCLGCAFVLLVSLLFLFSCTFALFSCRLSTCVLHEGNVHHAFDIALHCNTPCMLYLYDAYYVCFGYCRHFEFACAWHQSGTISWDIYVSLCIPCHVVNRGDTWLHWLMEPMLTTDKDLCPTSCKMKKVLEQNIR